MSRYQAGYCSELQRKNAAAFPFPPSFLALGEEGLISVTGLLVFGGHGAWRQLQQVLICSGDVEWVTVLPAACCSAPDVCCPQLRVFEFLPTPSAWTVSFLILRPQNLLKCPPPPPQLLVLCSRMPGTISRSLAFHFAFITCYSALSVQACLTGECRRQILFTFVSSVPFLKLCMFSHSRCSIHFWLLLFFKMFINLFGKAEVLDYL